MLSSRTYILLVIARNEAITSLWDCFVPRNDIVTFIYVRLLNNYSAYPPDLPGCAATGDTLAEVQQQIKEAIEFHLEGLREEGLPIPEPTTICDYVEAR